MTGMYDGKNNKRNYYRIKFNKPMCTEMTISTCYGKPIKTGFSNICVKDIGPGGLSFISTLSFPVESNIVYGFRFTLLHKTFYLKGVIVRRNDLKNNIYEYGVKFNLDQRDEQECITLFNNLSIIIRKNTTHSGCKFCDKNTYPCKIQKVK